MDVAVQPCLCCRVCLLVQIVEEKALPGRVLDVLVERRAVVPVGLMFEWLVIKERSDGDENGVLDSCGQISNLLGLQWEESHLRRSCQRPMAPLSRCCLFCQ